MTRQEIVRRLVQNEICDDYENIDQIILPAVREVGAILGLTVARTDIVEALESLVKDGLAKAYELSALPGQSRELDGMPPVDRPEEVFRTYFLITDEGMKLQLADEPPYPLDDSGRPIPGLRIEDSEVD